MPPSKTQYVLTATRDYLRGKHASDPARYPAEIKAIAQEIGVARNAFYKADPAVVALVAEIERAADAARAGQAGKPALVLTLDGGASAAADATTAELEREIREGLARVVWAMRSFVSLVEHSSGVAEAPLHLAELDTTLTRCRAIYRDLQAPYAEWAARRAAGVAAQAEPAAEGPYAAGPQERLDLDGTAVDGGAESADNG